LIDYDAGNGTDEKTKKMFFLKSDFIPTQKIDYPKQDSRKRDAYKINSKGLHKPIVNKVFNRRKVDGKKYIGSYESKVRFCFWLQV
jgi:hypothetical protein